MVYKGDAELSRSWKQIKINFSLRWIQPKVRRQPKQGEALETLVLETLGNRKNFGYKELPNHLKIKNIHYLHYY